MFGGHAIVGSFPSTSCRIVESSSAFWPAKHQLNAMSYEHAYSWPRPLQQSLASDGTPPLHARPRRSLAQLVPQDVSATLIGILGCPRLTAHHGCGQARLISRANCQPHGMEWNCTDHPIAAMEAQNGNKQQGYRYSFPFIMPPCACCDRFRHSCAPNVTKRLSCECMILQVARVRLCTP